MFPIAHSRGPAFYISQPAEDTADIDDGLSRAKEGWSRSEGLDLLVLHGITYSFWDAVIGQPLLPEPLFFLLTKHYLQASTSGMR